MPKSALHETRAAHVMSHPTGVAKRKSARRAMLSSKTQRTVEPEVRQTPTASNLRAEEQDRRGRAAAPARRRGAFLVAVRTARVARVKRRPAVGRAVRAKGLARAALRIAAARDGVKPRRAARFAGVRAVRLFVPNAEARIARVARAVVAVVERERDVRDFAGRGVARVGR